MQCVVVYKGRACGKTEQLAQLIIAERNPDNVIVGASLTKRVLEMAVMGGESMTDAHMSPAGPPREYRTAGVAKPAKNI